MTDAFTTAKRVYLSPFKDYMEFSNPESNNPGKVSRVTLDTHVDSSPQCSAAGKKASVILR